MIKALEFVDIGEKGVFTLRAIHAFEFTLDETFQNVFARVNVHNQ